MKGSIRERSPGHWAIILDQRDPATGKRKRKWHSFAGTKREAQVECSRLITAMKGGDIPGAEQDHLGRLPVAMGRSYPVAGFPKVARALCRHRQSEHQACARRRRAYQAEARSDLGGLLQGARQRPARRQGRRPVTPYRGPHAPRHKAGARSGRSMGTDLPATLLMPSILRRSNGSRCRPTTSRKPRN